MGDDSIDRAVSGCVASDVVVDAVRALSLRVALYDT